MVMNEECYTLFKKNIFSVKDSRLVLFVTSMDINKVKDGNVI